MSEIFKVDPAGVFACALSLYRAGVEREQDDHSNGCDDYMRKCMTVARDFEHWACRHVDFELTDEVWAYDMEERFGSAFLYTMGRGWDNEKLTGLECRRIADRLELPLKKAQPRPAVEVRPIPSQAQIDQLASIIEIEPPF